jgi:hypothetical protein
VVQKASRGYLDPDSVGQDHPQTGICKQRTNLEDRGPSRKRFLVLEPMPPRTQTGYTYSSGFGILGICLVLSFLTADDQSPFFG